MKIGIDCISIDPLYKGGVNTYTFGLLSGFLSLEGSGMNFIIFCTSKNKTSFDIYAQNDNVELIILDAYRTVYRKIFMSIPFLIGSSALWKFFNDLYVLVFDLKNLIENNCDLLYTPTTTLKFYNLNIPTVLSMHDIQQYHYPEFFSKKELRLRRLTFENSATNVTIIQASSLFIKKDLLDHFPSLDANQIVVIPEGVNLKEYGQYLEENRLEKYNLPDDFLFFPAQLWKHKNHITILRALKKIEINHQEKIPLIMTGGKYSSSDQVLNFINSNKMDYVHYLGKVEFLDLLSLYKEAKFLVTAVLYESNSLPILEAAASGIPIIASSTPPNIEMSENLVINFFEPLDVDQCSNIILQNWKKTKGAISEEVLINSVAVKLFSWENIAILYSNNFKKILNVDCTS